MFKKEIFRERCLQLANNVKLATAAGVTPGTMHKYLDPKMPNIPTADTLFNIAEAYKVSVDWLIGRTDNKIINDSLSPSDVCQALVSICESFPEIELKKFSKKEICYDVEISCDHYQQEEKENDYISISFPGWAQLKTSSDFHNAFTDGNYLINTKRVNDFLLGYSDIRNAKSKNDFISSEHYNQIIIDRLQDMKDLDKRLERFMKQSSDSSLNVQENK